MKVLRIFAVMTAAAVILTTPVYADRATGVKPSEGVTKAEEKPRIKNTSYVDTPKAPESPREIKLNAAIQGVWNIDYAMVDGVKHAAADLAKEWSGTLPSLTFYEDGTVTSSGKAPAASSYIQKIASKDGVMTLTVGSARVGGDAAVTFRYTTKTKLLTADYGEYAAALGLAGTKIAVNFVKDASAVPAKLSGLTIDGGSPTGSADTRKLEAGKNNSTALKASKSGVTWLSTDMSVVTVSKSGVVKPVATGTAQVLAYVGKEAAAVKFTVGGKNPSKIPATATVIRNVKNTLTKLLKNNTVPYKPENYIYAVTENEKNYIVKVTGTAAKVNEIKNGKIASATFTFKVNKSDLSGVYRKQKDGSYKKVTV